MSQSKLTDYFECRKRKGDSLKSSRKKLVKTEILPTEISQNEIQKFRTKRKFKAGIKKLSKESDGKSVKEKILDQVETFSSPDSNQAVKQVSSKIEDTNILDGIATFRKIKSNHNMQTKKDTLTTTEAISSEKSILYEIEKFRKAKAKHSSFEIKKRIENDIKEEDQDSCLKNSIEDEIKQFRKLKKQREKTPPVSIKEDTTEIPAFEKYKHLISPKLPLPPSYKKLLDIFVAVDTICHLYVRRKELITFEKLKLQVQRITKKSFERKQLSQIQQVYDKAFNFRFENKELIIEPILDGSDGSPVSKNNFGELVYTPSKLLFRKQHFHYLLLDLVKDEHDNFLTNLSSPVKVDKRQLTSWHPKFILSKVHDIPECALPGNNESSVKYTSVETALENLANLPKTPEKNERINIPSPVKKTNPKLKGVSQSLLDRIREKEAKIMAKRLTRTPEEEKRFKIMERLPDISRIIRQIFVGHNRPAMLLTDLIEKVNFSYKSQLTSLEMQSHIQLLAELSNDIQFMSCISIGGKMYVKLNMKIDVNNLRLKLQEKLDSEKKAAA